MSTKLGPHVLRGAPDLSEYIQAGIAVAKFAGDWGMAGDVPKGVLVIGRLVVDQKDYTAQKQKKEMGQTPLEAVQKFLQDQLPTYQANPHIKYWEGHNEPVWSDEEGMTWYAEFEVERMRLMAELGLKCVIGNFATGTPDLALWSAFLPALQVAREYEAILGLHEYSCPWMWWMTGKHQLDPNVDEGDEGWTTLRYRKVYRQHLIPNGLGDVPLVITECGIDYGVTPKPPGVQGGTWRELGDFWERENDEPDKADYYFRQLVWYDEELQKDDYVIGATIYTWGSFGGDWARFDVAGTEVSTKLIAYTQANPAEPFEYPGATSDGEIVGPGEAEILPDRDLGKLYPVLYDRVQQLLAEAHAEGLNVAVYEAYRSFGEQQKRYDEEEIARNRPGYSWHQYGLACDLVFKDDNGNWSWDPSFDWQKLGEIGKRLGLEWGGGWADPQHTYHFEMCRGMSINQAYNCCQAGGIPAVWVEFMCRIPSRRRLELKEPPLQGEDIKEVQWRLSSLKYLEAQDISGVFAEITDAAVRELQRTNGLIVDGIIGPQTWAALTDDQALPKPEKPKLGYLKVGIDANRPITPTTGDIEGPSASPHILASTGARWVRLNFILGPWSHPDDPMWKDTYHRIIQGLIDAWGGEGPQIYALVGAEATCPDPRNLFRFPPIEATWALSGYTSAHLQKIEDYIQTHIADVGLTPDEWIERYADHFETIVREFSNQIHVFETFNEPDGWHDLHPPDKPGDKLDPWGKKWERAWVHPYWLAKMLQSIYQRVKLYGVKVITGPLEGLWENWDVPATYLGKVYEAGRRLFGWSAGNYPFDGVGYHLYLHEGFNPNKDEVAANIQRAYAGHLNRIECVIKQNEGQDADRKLYISEFGWPTPNADSVDEQDFQAHAMRTAFGILKDAPRVALAIWFCTQDFPDKNYGLYKMGPLGPATQKKVPFEMFVTCAEAKEVVPEEAVPGPRVCFHGADQAFEHGRMIWREDKTRIYVLYDDKTWADHEDTFDLNTDPVITGLQPPAGFQEPAFGFGKVWREQPGVRDGLGWAKEGEQAYPGAIQCFAWGQKLWARVGVYLLRNDGTWRAE